MGDKCNKDQFVKEGMTSTRTHHHLAAHHSKSNWSLGWDESTADVPQPARRGKAQCNQNQNHSNIFAPMDPVEPRKTDTTREVKEVPVTGKIGVNTAGSVSSCASVSSGSPCCGGAEKKVSSNSYADGSNQNCGNFITDRPTTKVHAPPGGRSQIFFG